MTSEELYNRLVYFAQRNQRLVKSLTKTAFNFEYGGQLIRSSASPGANYIEAIEASSRKDFIYRLKICRKETRETVYWLVLIEGANENSAKIQQEIKELIIEGNELIRIFTSSILTSERNQKMKIFK